MDNPRGRNQFSQDQQAEIKALVALIIQGDANRGDIDRLECLLDVDNIKKLTAPELRLLVKGALKSKVYR